MSDARFEDGGDKALRLKAMDGEDLTVLSSLAQDAVFPAVLTLSGDGAIAIDVEALEIMLRDVTRPYIAPSRKVPQHD